LLELIHSDLCGSINPPTYFGFSYSLTFIDNKSHYTIIYLLKHKFETFDKFQIYKKLVENQTSKKIITLRFDNGGEYRLENFNLFCQIHGITRQYTTSDTPQQNSFNKRKNCTLISVVVSMLSHSCLSKRFWGEALLTANYLQN
jgi:hypothetical protein